MRVGDIVRCNQLKFSDYKRQQKLNIELVVFRQLGVLPPLCVQLRLAIQKANVVE